MSLLSALLEIKEEQGFAPVNLQYIWGLTNVHREVKSKVQTKTANTGLAAGVPRESSCPIPGRYNILENEGMNQIYNAGD